MRFTATALSLMLSSLAAWASSPAQPWKWLEPLPQGNALVSAATDGQTLVAVGDFGAVLTKPVNGGSWQLVDTSQLRPIRGQSPSFGATSSILWTGQRFIISGFFKEGFLESPDGRSWTVVPNSRRLGVIDSESRWNSPVPLVRIEDKIVGIQTTVTYMPNHRIPYIRSTDHGQSWIQGWLPPVPRLPGQPERDIPPYTTLTTHRNLFVAGGGNGMIVTSEDGSNWVRRGAGVTTGVVRHMASNGQALAASVESYPSQKHELLYSPDGVVWSKVGIKPIRDQLRTPEFEPNDHPFIGKIFSDGSRLVAEIEGRTFLSTNGSSWSMVNSAPSGTPAGSIMWMGRLGDQIYFLTDTGGIGKIDKDGNYIMEVGTSSTAQHFGWRASVAGLDSVGVAVSWHGSASEYARIDGSNQISSTAFTLGYNPKAVFQIGNQLVLAAWDYSHEPAGTQFFRSTDAVSWEPAGSGSFPGDTLKLVGADAESGPVLLASTVTEYDNQTWGSTTTMRLYRPSRGLTGWNEIAVPGNTTALVDSPPLYSLEPSIQWDGRRFILRNTAGELWQSPDGNDWSKLPALPTDSRNFLLVSGNFWETVDDSRGEMEKNHAGHFASNGETLVVRPAKLYLDTYNYNANGQLSPRWKWQEWGPDVFFIYDFATNTWTRALKPPLNQYSGGYREVVWNGTHFVSANGGAGFVLASVDGFRWTRHELRTHVDKLYLVGSRLVVSNDRGGALIHPTGLSEVSDENRKFEEHGLGLFVSNWDEAIHLYEITEDGQTTVDRAPLLKDTRNQPISWAGMARLVGGLVAFFFEDEPIPVPLPATPEMAVEKAGRKSTLWLPDFNLRTGAFLGVRRIQVDLDTGVVVPLTTLAASHAVEIRDAERRLNADFNADGVKGDGVARSLSGGLYAMASGALYYSSQSQSIGQPARNALLLRDTRGNPLAQASFMPGFNLMSQAGGTIGTITANGALHMGIPNYVLPRGAGTPVLSGLTIHAINASSGRIMSTTIMTAAKQMAAILAAEAEFTVDFNRDGVVGDAVARNLGGGVYTTASGALYYSAQSQTLGQPIHTALMLRDARGNPLNAAHFTPRNELIQAASSSVGRSEANGVLTLAIPQFTAVSRMTGMNPTNQPALPRFNHSQVWTGEKLIVWGGSYWTDNTQTTTRVYHDGGIYDPATDTWKLINSTDPETPTPRAGHTAVWTGSKMVVWGGSGARTRDSNGGLAWDEYNDGGIYDPATDTWEPIAMVDPDIPTPRAGHTAVWTGNRMIVWGGGFESNGAAFNPANDADPWSPLDTINAPQARVGHGAVVAGGRMAIWGGSVESTSYENSVWQGSGAFYDYASGEWESISPLNAPWGGEGWWAEDGERGAEILWTGSKLLVLPINSFRNGRWVHSGGIYNSSTSTWESIATTGAPNARPYMAAITRDGSLFAAGSSGNNFAGLVYNFGTKRWSQVMRGVTGSFQGRRGSWAPELGEMLVFGGMWANTPSPFSGRAAGNRGLRLQVNKPVFSSLNLSRFDMTTGRLVSTTKLSLRQAQQARDEEIKFGIDFDGNGILGSAP